MMRMEKARTTAVRGQSGLSLIEMIVVLAIFMIALFIAGPTVLTEQRVHISGMKAVALQEDVRFAVQYMENKIREADSVDPNSAEELRIERAGERLRFYLEDEILWVELHAQSADSDPRRLTGLTTTVAVEHLEFEVAGRTVNIDIQAANSPHTVNITRRVFVRNPLIPWEE